MGDVGVVVVRDGVPPDGTPGCGRDVLRIEHAFEHKHDYATFNTKTS